jgi:hypothetical protein
MHRDNQIDYVEFAAPNIFAFQALYADQERITA